MDTEGSKKPVCLHIFNKARLYLLIPAIITAIFQSCGLEPNPTGNKVEPRVLNCDGFNLSSYSYNLAIKLNIGNYPTAVPNAYGYTQFENVLLPYDLEIAIFSQSCVFKGLNSTNPNIVLPNYFRGYFESAYNQCIVPIEFPVLEPGDAGYLKFISKDMSVQDTLNFIYGNSNNLKLYIPIEKTEISGKLIFIQCKTASEYGMIKIVSYEKFGMKDINVKTGLNKPVSFSPQEIEFNPPETQVDITFVYPEIPELQYSKINLSFPDYSCCSNILVGYNYWHHPYYIRQIIPASLPIQYDIAISSEYGRFFDPIHQLINGVELINVEPGGTENIIHNKLELLNPQNNQQGIDQNSHLSVNDEGVKGVYLFYINSVNTYSNVIIITCESSIRWGDLKYKNFTINQGTEYYWMAEKISVFNSLEEFTNKPYLFNQDYRSTQISDLWRFTTAP